MKAHPRAVGVFVLGAIALVLGAIVLLSSGNWFEPRHRFTVFFPGSVRGLNPGAAVTFRGVKVGQVKDVRAFLTGRDDTPIQIEVVLEVRTRVVESPEGMQRPLEGLSSQELAQGLIRLGVRARMLSQSLLTGQKYIDLDFLPKTPARFASITRLYPELPTTPTSIEKLSDQAEVVVEKLATLPLDQMLEDVRKALQSLREVLSSPDLKGAIAGANRVTRSLDPTVHDARTAIAEARVLIGNLDGRVTGLGGNTETAIKEMREVFAQTRQSLDSLDRTLSGADDTRLRAAETLEELEQAMKAIRQLVEYIQTHPEAVVQGKSKEKP
jgi:ABC-type transporter Mla subunit MlaD